MPTATPKITPPDWANLLEELLTLIAKKLNSALDFIRFGSVCRSWRSAAKPADLPPQTPWLLLPNPSKSSSSVQSFYCPLTQKTFTLNLPSPIPRNYILGSSHGWLVLFDEDSSCLCLLNPLNASHIRLPPIYGLQKADLSKASLTSDPAASGGRPCLVMVTFAVLRILMFIRLGDARWTFMDIEWAVRDPAVTYHKNSFYVACPHGRSFVCSTRPRDQIVRITGLCMQMHSYLVESDDGERLFRVARTFHKHERKLQIVVDRSEDVKEKCVDSIWSFEVFELDTSENKPVWSKINGIGRNALFLSPGSSLCVKTSDISNGGLYRCRENSVYFAENDFATSMALRFSAVGVLDLHRGETEILHCYPPSDSGSHPQGIWFTPSIRIHNRRHEEEYVTHSNNGGPQILTCPRRAR